MADPDPRYERRVREVPRDGDKRSHGQHDYDRVVYCSAFMRLAGVAEVAHTSDSAVVHNRMIHSVKVATIGRGLANRLVAKQPDVAQAIKGPDPDVVAAAGLAHDLGHPPFGHVAERELDHLVQQTLGKGGFSGFEGNAQSFRAVTKLSVRKREAEWRGLNLTRATLNAILKYPWMREAAGPRCKKWGAYHTEKEDFGFARAGSAEKRRSVEAEIMDFADDVTYSTHDLEDYYRAGLLPLDRLLGNKLERKRFLDASITKWKKEGKEIKESEYEAAFDDIIEAAPWICSEFTEPYNGTRQQRGAVRTLASTLIDRFFAGIQLCEAKTDDGLFVEIDPRIKREIRLLKELIWYYIIPNRSLAIQEEGQRRIIETLFRAFLQVNEGKDHHRELRIQRDLVAPRYREQLDDLLKLDLPEEEQEQEQVRVVVDVIAEMSEFQAVQAYTQLTGYAPNSFLDFVQR